MRANLRQPSNGKCHAFALCTFDLQSLWTQYQGTVDPKGRKDLIGRIQNLIHQRTMFIPLTNTNSPAAVGPRVKGDPYRVQPLIWYTAPFEDMELTK